MFENASNVHPPQRAERFTTIRKRASFFLAHQLLALPSIERAFLQEALCSTPAQVTALEYRLMWIAAEAARGTCPVSLSRMRWELLANSPYCALVSVLSQLQVPRSVRDDEVGQWAVQKVERCRRSGDAIVVVADFFGPCIAHFLTCLGDVTVLCPVPQVNERGVLTGAIGRSVVGADQHTAMFGEIARQGLDGGDLLTFSYTRPDLGRCATLPRSNHFRS